MVGVMVGVVADVGVVVGLGVAVAWGLAVGLLVGLVVTVGMAVDVAAGGGVGLMKITRIAPSSGTGETILLPEMTTPMMTTTRTMIPTMMVSAAIVFRRSSILPYFISSFLHAANVHVGQLLHP